MNGVLVIAKQRSGTNFLRGMLSTVGGLKNYGEVFQPRSGTRKSHYDNWREAADLSLPLTYNEAVRQAERYLRSFAGKVPVVDVKYNSLHRIIGVWHSPVEAPPIVVAALNLGFTIVHLERRNRLEHAVSTHVAAASGVYVAKTEENIDAAKHRLDPTKLLETASRYDAEVHYVNSFLGFLKPRFPAGRITNLFYEDLNGASPDELRVAVQDIVRGFDIVADDPVVAPTRKIILDWRERVENAREVLEVFNSRVAEQTGDCLDSVPS